MNSSSLIYIPQKKNNATVRLLCFSYAGGSAATYIPWINSLPSNVELALAQLPGRGSRLSEPPYQSMNELVKDLFIALEKVNNKPFIFLGHSMGARVAYELILMLYRFGHKLPIRFIASGSIAPFASREKSPIHHLPDEQFIEEVETLNGTPKEILENKEIMQLLLPTLRADFKIIESYCNRSRLILPTKVSVLAGDMDDEVQNVEDWFTLFESNTGIHWVSGDHFFIEKNRAGTLEQLNKIINSI